MNVHIGYVSKGGPVSPCSKAASTGFSPIPCELATRLVQSQPPEAKLNYLDCLWAVAQASTVLDRRPTVCDLDRLESALSTPLLLLASAHSQRKRRWTKQLRAEAAHKLLQQLLAEKW